MNAIPEAIYYIKVRMKFKAYEKIVSLIEHAREAKDTLKSKQEQAKGSH